MSQAKTNRKQGRKVRIDLTGVIALQVLLACIIITAAYLAFAHYRSQVRDQVEADLLAVSQHKTQQITDFLQERLGDAEVLVQRNAIWRQLEPVADRAAQPPSGYSLLDVSVQMGMAYGYRRIVVFDRDRKPVYPSTATTTIEAAVGTALEEAFASGRPAIVDLHRGAEGNLLFGVMHPVRAKGDSSGTVAGAAYLEMDATEHLFRFIAAWPTSPSATGEAFMIRKTGDDRAVFLSVLRHAPDIVPLSTYRSLDNPRMLVARAAITPPGVFRGTVDYRGMSVLAATSRIPGTPWLLITKIDMDEAEAGIIRLSRIVVVLTLLFLTIGAVAVHSAWRGQLADHAANRLALELQLAQTSRQAADEQRQRNRIEARYARIFDDSPLPKQVHETDDLRILAINPAHEKLFGYAIADIAAPGLWFEKAYPDTVDREKLREQWLSDIATARAEGTIIESPDLHIRCKDGSVRLVRGSMSVSDEHIIIAWTDVTELRRKELALFDSERRFRGLVEQTVSGFFVLAEHKVAYINPRLEEMTGWKAAEVIGHAPEEFVDAESASAMHDARRRLERGERAVSVHLQSHRRDGTPLTLAAHSSLGHWDGKPALIAMLEDVTERLRAEEKIRGYVRQLEASTHSALSACAKMVELRDPYTAGHQNRVGLIASALARELGWAEERCKAIELTGLVHDIGKVAVPAEYLTKPTRLTASEFAIIKNHAQAGYEILKGLQFDTMPVADIVRQHHERLDGSGYPQGLKGDAILPEARILAIADVFESMVSYRPYRPALGLEAALEELQTHRGTRYDAAGVDALNRLIHDKHYKLPA
jgi:PAS domain S-box-containing protein/putative nucleotidyltransferase with HDIG domain